MRVLPGRGRSAGSTASRGSPGLPGFPRGPSECLLSTWGITDSWSTRPAPKSQGQGCPRGSSAETGQRRRWAATPLPLGRERGLGAPEACLEPGPPGGGEAVTAGAQRGPAASQGEGLILYLTPPTPLPEGCVSGPSVCRQLRCEDSTGEAGEVGRGGERGRERRGERHTQSPAGNSRGSRGKAAPAGAGRGASVAQQVQPRGPAVLQARARGAAEVGTSGGALALGGCVASVPTQRGWGWHPGAALPVTAGLGAGEPRAASWARVGSVRRDRGRDARAPHGPRAVAHNPASTCQQEAEDFRSAPTIGGAACASWTRPRPHSHGEVQPGSRRE